MGSELFQDLIAGLVLGFFAYASTNLDNLLLSGSIAASGAGRKNVVRGFFLSTCAVLVLSIAFIAIAGAVPAHTLGWLGLVPLVLGLRLLFSGGDGDSDGSPAAAGTMPVAILLLSNSSDTIATFGPLLAESEQFAIIGMVGGFILAAITGVSLAMRLAARLDKAGAANRIAEKLGPLVMIAIGIYILLDTTTDTI